MIEVARIRATSTIPSFEARGVMAKKKARSRRPASTTILTENINYPKGQGGTRIDERKYEAMRTAILKAVPRSKEGIAFRDLVQAVKPHLPRDWSGSVSWYVTTVKLDLEVKGEIARIEGSKPQRLRKG